MARKIKPKVSVIGYGPKIDLGNKGEATPDEIIRFAALTTYKDISILDEIAELKKEGEYDQKIITKSLIGSAGAGHASMSTTPGIWFMLEGDCSKAVDSIFTGTKYGSFLMPSSRRIPVNKEQIVVPDGILKQDIGAVDQYMKASKGNIETYEFLKENKIISKQEASKIVQYGHRGGGVMFMPLETIINFAKDFEDNDSIPQEGKEVISQLEEFIHNNGMGITYEAKKSAPRIGSIIPTIFHYKKNIAQELKFDPKNQFDPFLMNLTYIQSDQFEKQAFAYLKKHKEILSSVKNIKQGSKELLNQLEPIVTGYNDCISATIGSRIPWRIWGEVKRHRTLDQTPESIYWATKRAVEVNKKYLENPNVDLVSTFSPIFSIPNELKKDRENLKKWVNTFSNSLTAYENLLNMGVKKSDAILVIPRGLKLNIVKRFNLFNLTAGYMSLRLCGTCEPEMKDLTEKEHKLILNNEILPDQIKKLIMPKCGYVGFCPDRNCGKINKFVKFYDQDIHKKIKKHREAIIKSKL
jgi:thymidylate synthase ThyX